ncbi:hypothetical protein [Spirosoma flavum]|uniref:Uncharacterized protein n=1 Tax=Spirosoma flavum TaxID=2048557 RepID=A0ABW6AQZ0_9BACT
MAEPNTSISSDAHELEKTFNEFKRHGQDCNGFKIKGVSVTDFHDPFLLFEVNFTFFTIQVRRSIQHAQPTIHPKLHLQIGYTYTDTDLYGMTDAKLKELAFDTVKFFSTTYFSNDPTYDPDVVDGPVGN